MNKNDCELNIIESKLNHEQNDIYMQKTVLAMQFLNMKIFVQSSLIP